MRLERGDGGHAFFIADPEKQTFRREFIASSASLQGLSIDTLRSMPYWLALTVGRVLDAVWTITRKKATRPTPAQ